MECPESIEELEELEKHLPLCKVTLYEQATARLKKTPDKSERQVERDLHEGDGAPFSPGARGEDHKIPGNQGTTGNLQGHPRRGRAQASPGYAGSQSISCRRLDRHGLAFDDGGRGP